MRRSELRKLTQDIKRRRENQNQADNDQRQHGLLGLLKLLAVGAIVKLFSN